MTPPKPAGPRSTPIAMILGVWLLAAVALGASGVLATLQPPAPQLLLLAITALTLVAAFRVEVIRRWVDTVDVRVLTAFHLTRFVGIYFLMMVGRGMLPAEWAVRAGWGDILVATLAAILLLSGAPVTRGRWRAYRVWNYLAALDIAIVVVTAARTAMRAPASMRALQVLPLSLLITFFVPLIIASHVLLARRLWPAEPDKLDRAVATP